jgi:hypothetical protein
VIELVHDPDIDRDEEHENIDAALLGKPETEFEAPDPDLVELFHKENSAAIGDNEPDRHEDTDPLEIGSPVFGIGRRGRL